LDAFSSREPLRTSLENAVGQAWREDYIVPMAQQQRRDPEHRPSPEALLEAARRESSEAGKLKIFVGAAPGVGKTYEMLQSAHARKKAGVDLVVGIVETHGRAETEALLHGLEVIPRKRIVYKDQIIDEMDLDALIARRPRLALVDELAHTNAPGSRHPKRYLDVEELLSRGIDVYTAVNVQHIESLNDVVAQITHVRVRETVPDSVFDRADAIELIDLTPDDLIQRLKEGKVYVPKQAERALEHYFSPGNLTALRELALRRTAERVDEQLLTHMQANAIAWPIRYAWPRRSAARHSLSPLSDDASPTTSSASHKPTMSPTLLSVNRRVAGGSNSRADRWCMIWFVAPVISVST
jgi:two-component system sensor histidine kinase KdpD